MTLSRMIGDRRNGRDRGERIGGAGGRLGSSKGERRKRGKARRRSRVIGRQGGADAKRRRVARALERWSSGVARAGAGAVTARASPIGEEGAGRRGPTGKRERERERFGKKAESIR